MHSYVRIFELRHRIEGLPDHLRRLAVRRDVDRDLSARTAIPAREAADTDQAGAVSFERLMVGDPPRCASWQ